MATLAPSQSVVMAGVSADLSSTADAGPSEGSGAAMFTCLSCSIAYPNPEDQRAHYRTDLHRYNMKRRIANLPPVRADVFDAKILERRTQPEEGSAANQDRCRVCSKSFSSPNAFQSHVNSKKHKEAEARVAPKTDTVIASRKAGEEPGSESLIVKLSQVSGLDNLEDVADALPQAGAAAAKEARPSAPMSLQVAEDATEEEIQAAIDAKVATSRRIDPTTSCIFCNETGFTDLDKSLQHMSRYHGFFVPEQEYLVDSEGLMQYLADKVCVGNICLYCNGKGRGFGTGEAVRKHMVDKSHCKVAYEAEEDKLELSDFYDFTSSYPDAQWEDLSDDEDLHGSNESEGESDEEEDVPTSGIRYGDNEFELVLPSGARLGHRSMRRYYNQSLRPTGSVYTDSTSGRQLAHRLNEKKALDPTAVENRGGHIVHARNRGEAREAKKHISTYRDMTRREQFKTQVGYRNNNQKHFRDPLLQ